jgi:hypothetical protein
MNFLKRIFGKGATPSESPSPAGDTTAPDAAAPRSLGYNEGLAEFDGMLVKLLRERVASRLDELREKHLDVFCQLLAQPIAGLPPAEFVDTQLQSLVEALETWKEHVTTEVHEMVKRGRIGRAMCSRCSSAPASTRRTTTP